MKGIDRIEKKTKRKRLEILGLGLNPQQPLYPLFKK